MKATKYRKQHCELCKETKPNFKEFLEKVKSITSHYKNLQYLATEICKVKTDISPKNMDEVFRFSKILSIV